jgi:hypothetical protein
VGHLRRLRRRRELHAACDLRCCLLMCGRRSDEDDSNRL